MEYFYGDLNEFYALEDNQDSNEINEALVTWQQELYDQLVEIYPSIKPYQSDQSATFGFLSTQHLGALLITLSYLEEGKNPPTKINTRWMEDKLFLKQLKLHRNDALDLIYNLPDILLPYQFDNTFEFIDIANNAKNFGSLIELSNTLIRINKHHFKVEDVSMERFQDGESLADQARLALCTLIIITNNAIEQQAVLIIED